jgi:hypothetical protein
LLRKTLFISETDAEILRIAGDGSMSAGARELVIIYRDLWALGYRPTVPVKLFVRRYKKKGPRRAPKDLAMAPQYNPKQDRE